MNYISSIIRLFEIPQIKFYNNNTPFIQCNVEIAVSRNYQSTRIILVNIWGELAYSLNKYYKISDYLLIEGYLLNTSSLLDRSKNIPKLTISQIYPYSNKLE